MLSDDGPDRRIAMSPSRASVTVAVAISAIFTASTPCTAQQARKVQRIGYLAPGSPPAFPAFGEGLRAAGYVEGENITVEYRWAEGRLDHLPELAAELMRHSLDVIFTNGYVATAAALKAGGATPIVFSTHVDPVEAGLVTSLARPGGRVTGMTLMAPDLAGKRLQILKETIPGASRVAIMANTENPGSKSTMRHLGVSAGTLGIRLQVLEGRNPKEFDELFAAMMQGRAAALHVSLDPLFLQHRVRIIELAAKHRLPAIYDLRQFAEDGGLMSYGPNFRDHIRSVAGHVARVLKGAKPADLPVEQPTKIELVINLKTAKALGLTIPQSILIRADQVIQ
jgi:putative ABC transport system substrate-binding protein